MAKNVDFFDGAQSSTTPTIGNVDTTNLACYANDAAYEAANAGSPSEGNIYCNTTDNTIHYYNGTAWTELADDDTAQTFTNKTLDGTSATGTNTISIDADDASYDNTTSGLTATNTQAAIDEVEGRLDTAETDITTAQGSADANTTDIADIRTTTGTADGATNMGTFTGSTLTDNTSVKTLLQELETAVEAVGGALVFAGTWDANANSPALADGTGTQGEFYIVSTAGTTSLDGIASWAVNDWAIFDGTVWRKIDNSELVTSVNGETGTVSLSVNDLDDLSAPSPGARDELRRDTGNTSWESYDPHSKSDDSTTGANAVLQSQTVKVKHLTSASLVSIDEIPAGYANQTFVMVNRTTVPLIVNNETGSTAANRILTGTSGPIDLDVDASLNLVYDSSSSRWRVVGGTGGGGTGTSGIITGNNSTADSTEGDWVAYADAAGNTPVDGTGGSPNITISRTTLSTEILQGKGSFELVKGAFDRQGEGASLDIEVPRYIRGQASQISFSYQATADFDFGSAADPVASPSDISVFLYDVTNSKILNTNQPGIFGGGLYKANVQIPSDCADVRVILHIATTNALAYDFIFDRVQLDVAPNEFLANMSDWVDAGAMTIGADTSAPTKGTVIQDRVQYRQVGSNYQCEYDYEQTAAGAAGSGEYIYDLPDGIQFDDEVIDFYTGSIVNGQSKDMHRAMVGSGHQGIDASARGTNSCIAINSTQFKVIAGSHYAGYQAQSSTYFTLSNANQGMKFRLDFAGKGITSGVSHPASIGLNAQAVMKVTKSGGVMTANTTIPSWNAPDKDTTGSFNATTGVYTVKSPGDYFVNANLQYTVSTNAFIRIYKNGVEFEIGSNDQTHSIDNCSVLMPDLKYGDEITMASAVTVTAVPGTSGTTLSIHKLGAESQPYAPRIAYLKDVKANTTDGGTFTSGAWQTRVLNTLSGDESFVSLSSNQFTLQPGTYHIKAEAPGAIVQRHKAKLRNITDTSDTLIGANAFTDGDEAMVVPSVIEGEFSISSATTFEIQHRGELTRATNGFGFATSFGVDEVYTQVKITKVL